MLAAALVRPCSSSSTAAALQRGAAAAQRRALATSAPAHSSESLTARIAPQLADERRRLFAVVHVNDRQWKVTTGDLIQLEGASPLEHGDRIKLEKVLAVGAADFSLFGRPLLPADHVTVEATVVERSHKSPELYYRHYNHHQTRITRWQTTETTTLRIDAVRASPSILSEHSSEETKDAQRE
ncbi:mrpl-21 [Pristionchus pacificus]|uniref:Large ribosomal subunit protein bL21m n=1 Tax=Pristionchus pacificus TaxID=54126 RepID=A0A2A6BAS1_PRIPA|nr:mrpl-21 [Pristionchus pacificus]|eukprot:PDM62967.1 mrpl-21 [Pristionchus pacificus]